MPDLVSPNLLKRLLREGRPAVGTMLIEIRQPSLMQIIAHAGFQFVLIDGEHGPFSIESVADLSRAARTAGMTPIVRIPEITYSHVTLPLDAGAQGLMVPRVSSADQVRTVLNMMRYPPDGRRGVVLGRGHTNFLAGDPRPMMSAVNEELLLVVQIEMQEALDNLDAILGVPGVDVALVGPTDLSIALGVHGKLDDPKMVQAIQLTIERCQKRHIVPAIHMNHLDQAIYWAERGMQMISISSEIGLLVKAGTEAVSSVTRQFARQQPPNAMRNF